MNDELLTRPLAISLMAGEVASLLSRIAVPVLYYLSEKGRADATMH